jgi:hypothetical protein
VSEFDLPPIPNVQLQPPQLTVPGYQPPSLSFLPPLSTGLPPSYGGLGGGSPAAMTDTFGHMTDPPAPNYFAPIPASPIGPLQLNGLGPISNAVNPWLANPMGVAADEQRKLDMMPGIDPGLAAQQTIIHAPAISF